MKKRSSNTGIRQTLIPNPSATAQYLGNRGRVEVCKLFQKIPTYFGVFSNNLSKSGSSMSCKSKVVPFDEFNVMVFNFLCYIVCHKRTIQNHIYELKPENNPSFSFFEEAAVFFRPIRRLPGYNMSTCTNLARSFLWSFFVASMPRLAWISDWPIRENSESHWPGGWLQSGERKCS
jgi:hypothetical protein